MELLIRVIDKPRSGIAALDSKRTTAGDVIVAMPDGHIWGREEVRNPEWRIIRVPGMGRTEAEALTAPELPESFSPNRLLRKRQIRIDIEQLDIFAGGELLAGRTATRKGVDCVIEHGAFVACRSLKPKLTDPRIIGPRTGVIG